MTTSGDVTSDHNWVIEQAINCDDELEAQSWLLLAQTMNVAVGFDVLVSVHQCVHTLSQLSTLQMHITRGMIAESAEKCRQLVDSVHYDSDRCAHALTAPLVRAV